MIVKMIDKPKITVLMPVYNAEKYLEESIESILNQTYKNFELIITYDDSSDDSLEIIQKYKQNDKRIKLSIGSKRGLITSLNDGIKMSLGEYIARMDADDISLPTRLEEQIKFMEENNNIGICGTWIEIFGEGVKSSNWKLTTSNTRLKAELLFSSCFAHPSVMIKKSYLIDNKFYYDINFLHAEDFELWTRLSDVTNFANIKKILLKYRIVNTSATRIADKNTEQRYQIIGKIFDKYLKKLNIINTKKENKLHFNLSINTRIKDNNLSFEELKEYFDKLLMANCDKNFFNNFALNKVLGKKWLWNFIYKKEMKAIFSKYFFYGIWGLFSK